MSVLTHWTERPGDFNKIGLKKMLNPNNNFYFQYCDWWPIAIWQSCCSKVVCTIAENHE